MDAKALLKKTKLFHDFNQFELLKLTEISRRLFLPKGDTIISEGADFEVDSSLYVVSEGQLKAAARLGAGMELVLAILGPADVFGEISFTDNLPRTADVTAMNDAELLVISHDELIALFESDRQIAVKFYRALSRVLAGRLREMNRRALEGSHRPNQ